jgi:hypothetical protein
MKLVREDPLVSDGVGAMGPGDKLLGPIAHQRHVLGLHSCAPIGVGKRSTYEGRDRGRCRWRCRSSEDQVIKKHLEARLGPTDHLVRIHRRSHRVIGIVVGGRRSSDVKAGPMHAVSASCRGRLA